MIFTRAEIEVLALCAWCKGLPIERCRNIPTEITDTLLSMQYIRESRNGLNYRPTPAGIKILNRSGFCYEQDKSYRSDKDVLIRRIQIAEVAGFFWRYGINVFCDAPHAEHETKAFLPSFALRRKHNSNILGGTKLTGFYYSDHYTFIPYYIASGSKGIYPDAEQRIFRAESLLCSRQPHLIYTGFGDLSDLIQTLSERKQKSPKCTTVHYLDAVDRFRCPVAFIPLNPDGMRQLRLLEIPDCSKRLIKNLLGKDYLPPDTQDYDGQTATENYLISIDCNIVRMEKAITPHRLTHIMLLPFQMDAVADLFQGKNVIFHPLRLDTVEEFFGLPPGLPPVPNIPFQTAKGEYIHVPAIAKNKNTGR